QSAAAVAQAPSPGIASTASTVLLTMNVAASEREPNAPTATRRQPRVTAATATEVSPPTGHRRVSISEQAGAGVERLRGHGNLRRPVRAARHGLERMPRCRMVAPPDRRSLAPSQEAWGTGEGRAQPADSGTSGRYNPARALRHRLSGGERSC